MSKKILAMSVAAVTLIVLAGVFLNTSMEDIETAPISDSVSITMSSSRPGCEADETCYVPNQIVVDSGQTITWINEDSAFHTVTSGHYDEQDGVFDSGQLDPAQKFSHTFAEPGQFSYYCKLHPWMAGEIIVQ
ncbi:MAG: cupredoxin domain-containing protein [Nitrososphaerota archaeon]